MEKLKKVYIVLDFLEYYDIMIGRVLLKLLIGIGDGFGMFSFSWKQQEIRQNKTGW